MLDCRGRAGAVPRLVPRLLVLAAVLLAPAAARAEVPFPSCASVPGCEDPYDYPSYLKHDPARIFEPPDTRVPNDLDPEGGGAWKYRAGTGLDILNAWAVTTGRPDVIVAVLDSGIRWNAFELVDKAALNTDELPVPVGCAPATSPRALPHDCDGNGVVNVRDFQGQACPGGEVSDENGNQNGLLDAQDLILLCSDGVDGVAGAAAPVANGFVDDIAGWDFVDDDNDPSDDVDYGHGTGEGIDMVAEAHNFGGAPGFAPAGMFMPLRVGDSFVAVESDFAQAVVYAVDRGVSIVSEALGAVDYSRATQAAVDYAYESGVPVIASAADEESRHHNAPALAEHTIWVNSIRNGDGTIVEETETYDILNGCTNYGGRAWVAISSTACSSEATGRSAGLVSLLVAHGKNLVDRGLLEPWDAARGIPYSAEEVRQLLRVSALDVDHAGDRQLSMLSLLSGLLSGPRPLRFRSRRFATQEGWDQYTGYGRPDAVRMLEAATDAIPPEADLSGSLRWFDVVDPTARPSVTVRGSAAAERAGGAFGYWLDVGCGVQPESWSRVGQGYASRALRESALATWRPAETAAACGFDPSAPIEDPDAHTVTLRLTVMDWDGNVGEDRRTVAVHSDPSLRFPPLHLGTSGEASPALVDLNRDGSLEIVYGTGIGAVHVLDGSDGTDLPNFPVWTDPIATHPSPAYASGRVPPLHEGIVGAVAADDLDGDGSAEIVAAGLEGRLYVWDALGRRRDGFPVRTDPAFSSRKVRDRKNDADRGIASAPTLADLDGDGALEILAGALDGFLYAWHADGTQVEGFPVRIADRSRVEIDPATGKATPREGAMAEDRLTKILSSPAVGDLDGDGSPEIVIASNEEYGGAPGFSTRGSNLLGTLFALGDEIEELGDLALDKAGRLYALHADGNAHRDGGGQPSPFLEGWPVSVPMVVSGLLPTVGTGTPGSPALANLTPQAAGPTAPLTAAIYATAGPAVLYAADGTPIHGMEGDQPVPLAADFPAPGFNGNVPETPTSKDAPFFGTLGSGAFGDLDGDLVPEYVATTGGLRKLIDVLAPGEQVFGDHQVTAWDPISGELFEGAGDEPSFPAFMDDLQFLSNPSLADVDGDGLADIIQGSGAYLVRAYRADGTLAPGWPKFTHGWLISSPTPGDVDGDGLIEVVTLTREGNLFVWDTPAAATRSAIQWQGFAHDRRNTGNLESGVSPLADAPLGFAEALAWELGAIDVAFAGLREGAPPGLARQLRRSFAPVILAFTLPLLEAGDLDFAGLLLPFLERALRFPHPAADALAPLHARLVKATARAASRRIACAEEAAAAPSAISDCAPWSEETLARARELETAAETARDAGDSYGAVLFWARIVAL